MRKDEMYTAPRLEPVFMRKDFYHRDIKGARQYFGGGQSITPLPCA